ncbi:MAG: hemerythrin domain-containing protein [Gallionella sp.]|jgi:hemerythrin-like metal-binding protein|nr:hemerythrin domain-containing protein [Gallionella sp.]MCK9353969.1 hemerythrin domain-containing protein [Gallionella sp.]
MEQQTWTKMMSVGNAFLDADHKRLLEMIEDVERAMRAQDTAVFSRTLKIFEDTVRIHFRNEELIAKTIDHPFEQHIEEHQYVLNELQQMEAELIDMHGRWSESASTHYFIFLSNWASEHIRDDDMLMKPALQAHPYDFRPTDLLES